MSSQKNGFAVTSVRTLRNNGIFGGRRASAQVEDDLMAHNRRRGSTSIKATYGMWVMPVATFISLTELKPHQEMVAERLVKEWDPSMRAVFFLSHREFVEGCSHRPEPAAPS